MLRTPLVLGGLLVAAIGLAACQSPTPIVEPPSTPSATATQTAAGPLATPTSPVDSSASTSTVLVAIIDGDTVETSAGRVRLIGIDTPERGECGHEEASAAIEQLVAPGDDVLLELPAGQNDVDRYGRLIRYVSTSHGIDLGMVQLEAGHAVARYDSRDGYPAHPREAEYHAAQLAELGPNRTVITTSCAHATPPEAAAPLEDSWWTQYSSCTRLKKNTVGHPTGPFNRDDPAEAEIYQWFAYGTGHNGDGDWDGLACE